MQRLRVSLQVRSPFGTPLAGDTLFGQLCWAIRERHGEPRLHELLDGYGAGRPFLVISDGFPAGWLPRPSLPDFMLGADDGGAKRKEMKRRHWLPASGMHLPLAEWLLLAEQLPAGRAETVTQNTINRLTGTTGTGQFAPRQVERLELRRGEPARPEDRSEVYVLHDPARIARDEIANVLEDVGNFGFGRDASTGLGKFAVTALEPLAWDPGQGRHALTLAPCAPDPSLLLATHCYYQPITRFGRHGNLAALGANPFKRPVLMLRTAALLTFSTPGVPAFHGRGLGGAAHPLSTALPATVHQGYAPLLPLTGGDLA